MYAVGQFFTPISWLRLETRRGLINRKLNKRNRNCKLFIANYIHPKIDQYVILQLNVSNVKYDLRYDIKINILINDTLAINGLSTSGIVEILRAIHG